MLIFKSGCVKFETAMQTIKHLSNEAPNNVWGIMFLFRAKNSLKNTIMFSRNIAGYEGLVSWFEKIELLEDIDLNLDKTQMAFIHSEKNYGMPMMVNFNPYSVPVQCEWKEINNKWFIARDNNLTAMVEKFSGFDRVNTNSTFSLEQNFVFDCLAGIDEYFLRNKLDTMQSKFNIFGNKTFILLDKILGFNFIGNFKTIKGGNIYKIGDIRKSKSLVFNE